MTTSFSIFTSNGGHSAKSPGASSGEYKEHEQTRLMSKAFIKAMRKRGCKVIDTTSDAKNAAAVLIEQVARCNKVAGGGKQLDLSWHLNCGGGTGTEVLYYSDDMKGLAGEVSAAIAEALGVRNRGAKQRKDLYFLRKTSAKALLVETCFIDSEPDMRKLASKRAAVAEAVADTLVGKAPSSKDSSTASSTKPTVSTAQTAYTGNSLVDYLKSLNKDSSFASRAALAAEYSVVRSKADYDGTYAQNNALLAAMRKAVGR